MGAKKILVIMIRIIRHFTEFCCFASGKRINKGIFSGERSTPNIRKLFEGALK